MVSEKHLKRINFHFSTTKYLFKCIENRKLNSKWLAFYFDSCLFPHLIWCRNELKRKFHLLWWVQNEMYVKIVKIFPLATVISKCTQPRIHHMHSRTQITRNTIYIINRTRTIFSIRHKLLAIFIQIFMKRSIQFACDALIFKRC